MAMILLIDAGRDNLKRIIQLRGKKHTVVAFRSGEEADGWFMTSNPFEFDLMIVGETLKGEQSGIEYVEHLRSTSWRKKPMIFLSPLTSDKIAYNLEAFRVKLVNDDTELLAEIERILD